MKWTADHDDVFVREIIAFTPWIYKRGSTERGEIWGRIADSLNSFESPQFRVTQRSVRDRYTLSKKSIKRKSKTKNERVEYPQKNPNSKALLRISSISLKRLTWKMIAFQEKKAKQEAEVSKAEEMRKMSLETFKETEKRNESGEEETPRKKKRASGSDAIGFLKEKTEMEVKLKAEEMELKRKEFESRKQEQKEKEEQTMLMQQMQQQQLQLLLKQQ